MRAGVNFSNFMDDTYSTDSQTGFNIAGLYNMPLMSGIPLYLQSGIGISMKGARNSGMLGRGVNSHFKSYNFEIPLVVIYEIQIGKQSYIVPELGLFYTYAFTGSLEGGDTFIRPYKKQELSTNIGDFPNSRIFHRSDFGIRVGLSFRYMKYLIGFAYDAGVINSYSKKFRDADASSNTGSWSINIGRRFGM